MSEPNYTKPTSQLDLEARQSEGYVDRSKLIKGTDPEPSDNGYIGVDPIYQNYASETERPLLAEGGPEAEIEKNFVTDDVDTSKGATPEGVAEAEVEAEEKQEETPFVPSGFTPPN